MVEIKKPVGRPAIHATPITVRVAPDLLAAIDAFIADQPDTPSRPEAIRRLVADHPLLQAEKKGGT